MPEATDIESLTQNHVTMLTDSGYENMVFAVDPNADEAAASMNMAAKNITASLIVVGLQDEGFTECVIVAAKYLMDHSVDNDDLQKPSDS